MRGPSRKYTYAICLTTGVLLVWTVGGLLIAYVFAPASARDLLTMVMLVGIVLGVGLLVRFFLLHLGEIRRWSAALTCPSCGYELYGLNVTDNMRCPECGERFGIRAKTRLEALKGDREDA